MGLHWVDVCLDGDKTSFVQPAEQREQNAGRGGLVHSEVVAVLPENTVVVAVAANVTCESAQFAPVEVCAEL